MKSDSIEIGKNGDGQGKENPKNQRSKRSVIRRPKEGEAAKEGELPVALKPKFPSQRIMRKKKSEDKLVEKEKEDTGSKDSEDKEKEKPEKEKKEGKEEKEEDGEESAPMELPVVEYNSIRPNIIPEEPQKSGRKQGPTKDNPSGRSDARKPKKAAAAGGGVLSEKEKEAKKTNDSKRKESPRKVSNEPMSSDDPKKKNKKNTTKRMTVKPSAPKSVQVGGPNSDAVLSNPIAPPKKPDRSARGASLPEKSVDEKAKKPSQAQVAQTPPTQKPSNTKKDPTGISQKTKNNTSTKSLDPSKRKKQKGFFKNVYKKTKFWSRKPDYDPTMELLCKSYVPPDYNEKNAVDFKPDLKDLFDETKVNLQERVKGNKATSSGDIFLNSRPFWLYSMNDDDKIPKVQIQLHRPLMQLYTKSPTDIYPKYRRVEPFMDPKVEHIMSLRAIDMKVEVTQGINEDKEVAKEKELKRVSANTFYGTMMFEVDKLDEKKKEAEAKKKKSAREEKKLVWIFPPEAPKDPKNKGIEDQKTKVLIYKLHTYHRKARVHPPADALMTPVRRTFLEVDYRVGERQRPRNAPKPTSSTPISSGSARAKVSAAEVKK